MFFLERKLSERKDKIRKQDEQKVNAGVVDAVYEVGKKCRQVKNGKKVEDAGENCTAVQTEETFRNLGFGSFEIYAADTHYGDKNHQKCRKDSLQTENLNNFFNWFFESGKNASLNLPLF